MFFRRVLTSRGRYPYWVRIMFWRAYSASCSAFSIAKTGQLFKKSPLLMMRSRRPGFTAKRDHAPLYSMPIACAQYRAWFPTWKT